MYDLLPTPTNLKLWNVSETPNCQLCDKPANLKHILSACPTALTGGRYKWRHDKVLSEIAHHLTLAVNTKRKTQTGPLFINFVKQGSAPSSHATGLLPTAKDWELLVDLKTQLKFPPEIAVTCKRPDLVLWSRTTKQVVLMELTVPWEEGVEEAYERKMLSYSELVQECRTRGWKTWCLPFEVGCRGFAAQSLWRCLKTLGILGKVRSSLIKSAENAAEYASRWIFEKRSAAWQVQEANNEINNIPQNRTRNGGYKPINKGKSKHKPAKMEKKVVNPSITFFFGYQMPLSNHHPCSFQVELPEPYGIKHMHSVEHLYMFWKAFFFDDRESCQRILDSTNARQAKRLGSAISNFIPDEWKRPKLDVMKECLVRKFTDSDQATILKQHLMTTHPVIIEASPSDTHWGIGFSKEQGPYVLKENWGDAENWLGRLLMELRNFLSTLNSLDPNTQAAHMYSDIFRKVQRGIKVTYDRNVYAAQPKLVAEPFITYLTHHTNITNIH